jgi:hypothetical protein
MVAGVQQVVQVQAAARTRLQIQKNRLSIGWDDFCLYDLRARVKQKGETEISP